jgi:hypothetical protein
MQPPTRPIPWIINLDHVPLAQQNRWVEPIAAGVHGRLKQPPDYGRIMLCRDARMPGIYVDARRGFRDQERRRWRRLRRGWPRR